MYTLSPRGQYKLSIRLFRTETGTLSFRRQYDLCIRLSHIETDTPSFCRHYNLRIKLLRTKTDTPSFCVWNGHRHVQDSSAKQLPPSETVTAVRNGHRRVKRSACATQSCFLYVFLKRVQTTRAKDSNKHCKRCWVWWTVLFFPSCRIDSIVYIQLAYTTCPSIRLQHTPCTYNSYQ